MVTVIDYDAGNLRSVETALHYLGTPFRITADPDEVRTAERIVLPGVGDARAAMDRLEPSGIADALRERVGVGVPMMGICLGSQIVLESSEENDATCLGLIPGRTVAFDDRPGRKVPHMGWNTIEVAHPHPIFTGIPEDAAFYFVHSYYPSPNDPGSALSYTNYGEVFPSAIGRDNVVATQFHPEKSGEFGLKMLDNFLAWNGGS